MRQQINKKEILKLLKLKEADDSKKGKLFIPRNIDKRAEEREEMIDKIIGNEELMKGIISKAADETSQDDYYDVYDWMDDVLSVVENELEGMGLNDSEGDIISDIKDKYDDYLIDMWGGSDDFDDNDDDFEQGKNPYECAKNYVEFLFNKSIMSDETVVGGGDLFYWNNNKIPKMNDDKAYGRFIKHLKYSMDNEIYSDEECEGTTFEDIEPFIKKLYSSEISRKSK